MEISKIVDRIAVTHFVEPDAFIQLTEERFARSTVSRMESGIVAIGATAPTYFAVPVRTGESGIKNDFLETFPISFLEIADKRIVSSPIRVFRSRHIVRLYPCKFTKFLTFVKKTKLEFMKKILMTAAFAVLGCCFALAQPQKRMAVVEFSANYMRSKPDYESGLETQELMGQVVEILREDRYWRQIRCPQPYTAWTTDLGLVEMDEQEIAAYGRAPKYFFKALTGHLYAAPSLKSGKICDLVAGDLLRVVLKDKFQPSALEARGKKALAAEEVSWKQAVTKGAWAEAMLPSGKRGWVLKEDLDFEHHWHGKASASVKGLLETADELVGVPYFWGGMTPKGVDCSGLVRVCAILNNIYLPRNASQMVHCGEEVPMATETRFWEESSRANEDGTYTPAYVAEMEERVKNLQPGDLVFFGYPASEGKKERITHVGIYIGDQHIIHSSHVVRKNSLIPGAADFYENSHKLIKARRLEMR